MTALQGILSSFNRQKLLCVDYSPFATFSQSLAALEMVLNGWSTKSKVCLLRWLDLQIFFLLQDTTIRYDLPALRKHVHCFKPIYGWM